LRFRSELSTFPVRKPRTHAMKKIALVALVTLFAGCSDRGFDLAPTIPGQGGYDILVRGEVLTCTLGQTFPIVLNVNADGGYRWDYTIVEPQVIRLDSSSTRPQYPNTVGGTSIQTFYFHAIGVGSCRILMIQHRAWESTVPPIEAVEYDITVRP